MHKLILFFLATIVFGINLQAQWVQTNGPYGGFVQCIAIIGDTVFIGTQNAGVFRSVDSGQNWLKNNNGLTNLDIHALIIKGNNIFAGSSGGGVYWSTITGTDWIEKNNGLEHNDITSFYIKDENIFVGVYGANGGVYVSTNNGSSWIKSSNGLPVHYYSFNVTSFTQKQENIFAGTTEGVYITTDNGYTWNKVSNGLSPYSYIKALTSNDSTLFVGYASLGIFKSTNNGSSWSEANDGLTDLFIYSLKSSNDSIFAGTRSSGVFLSVDNGNNWNPLNEGKIKKTVLSIALNNNKIFVGTSGAGILIGMNNEPFWTISNFGLINPINQKLAQKGKYLFVGSPSGIYKSSNHGDSWVLTNYQFTNDEISALMIYNECIFAGTQRGIYRSTNNGASWTEFSNGLTNLRISTLTNINEYLFAGTFGGGIFRSIDEGYNWIESNTGVTNFFIRSLGPAQENILAGVGENLYADKLISTNFGESWDRISIGWGSVCNVAQFAESNSNVFAGTFWGSGIYRSIDNGFSWHDVNNGITDYDVISIAADDNYIFAGTYYPLQSGNIFISSNQGDTWIEVSEGLYTVREPQSFAINKKYVFVGINGHGVWRRPLSDFGTTDLDDELEFPSEFSLEQNYPNPFNPFTTIKFSIPQNVGNENFRSVQLKIYDMLGNEIATLVDEQKSPGIYEVTFDGSNLSSGVYFYQLIAGNFSQTKKFVLMK